MKNTLTNACIICGNKKLELKDKFYLCKKCGYQTAGVEDYKELQKYYNEIDLGLQVQNILEEGIDSPLRRYHKICWRFLQQKGITKGKVCDIGCGVGVFLREMRRQGLDPYGYDVNKKQITIAKKKYKIVNVADAANLPMYARKMGIKKRTFDVITAFEVIEHIPNPRQFVSDMAAYIKKGGYIIISTPNYSRPLIHERWDYPPIHLSRFNKKNLSQLVTQEGFRVRQWISYNELGYYTNNIIHNLSLSKKILSQVVLNKSDSLKDKKTKLHSIVTIKQYMCKILDIPLYAWLLPQRTRGHTMVMLAERI